MTDKIQVLPLGPFPLGMDTYHAAEDEEHAVYQIGKDGSTRLVEAANVLLSDDGWVTGRPSNTLRVAATAGKNLFCGSELCFIQDGGTLKRVDVVDWSEYTLETGLDSNEIVELYEHNGITYWSDKTSVGRVLADGTATNHGLSAAPLPTLGTTTGTLTAGDYLVAGMPVDANGVAHGSRGAATVTVNGSQSITVNFSGLDSDATHVQIFCTQKDGEVLYYSQTVAVGALPATITTKPTSNVQPFGLHHRGPPAWESAFSYRSRLMLIVGNAIFPSRAGYPHLFRLGSALEMRPTTVLCGAGLDGGFFTICEDGAYWTEGIHAEEWQTVKRSNRKFAKGSLVVPGYVLPYLEISQDIALFVSEDGLTVGLPGGGIAPITLDRQRLDVENKRASISLFQTGSRRDIAYSLY